MNVEELLTVKEMAKFLKVSIAKLYNMMNEGLIPFVVVGETRRFVSSEVMKALKSNTKKALVQKLR